MRFPLRSDPQREHPFNTGFSKQEIPPRMVRRFSTYAQPCKVAQYFRRRLKTSVPYAHNTQLHYNHSKL